MGYVIKNRKDHQIPLSDKELSSKNEAYPLFLSFIASKVLASAENLELELKKKRRYEVTIDNLKDISILYTASHLISGINRANPNHGISASVNAKKKKIIVKGDISYDQIHNILIKKDSLLKHRISSVDC